MDDKTNKKNIFISNRLIQNTKNEKLIIIKINNKNPKNNSIYKNILRKNNNNNSILKKKRIKNTEFDTVDDDSNNNIQYIYENNSISYYANKNKNINCSNKNNKSKNNLNDSNNMSNFILLQKKTRKSLTDINAKKEQLEISKSIDNSNFNNNINIYNNGPKPKFISDLNNKQLSEKNCSENQIKFNNYVKKSSSKYFLLYRNPLKIKVMKKCFICDCFDQNLYHTEKCSHLFCRTCGKIYYEQKINNCIYNLTCPKYSCFKYINNSILKQILSQYMYEKFVENKDINSQTFDKNITNTFQNINSSREKSIRKNSIFSNENSSFQDNKTFIYNLTYQKDHLFFIDKNSSKKRSNKDLLLKRLTNRFYKNSDKDLTNEHVIKIGGSSKFNRAVKKLNELKNTYCTKCNKSSLFSVKNKPFIRCLNCGFSFCKFCYKKYDYYHFIRNNASACRVFFRARNHGKNNNYVYLHQLLYIFGGFIILFIGLTRLEVEYLSNYNHNKIYWIYFLMFFIFIIINLFILFIFLPYYPLLLLIVEL